MKAMSPVLFLNKLEGTQINKTQTVVNCVIIY